MKTFKEHLEDFRAFAARFLFASPWTLLLIVLVLGATYGRWLIGVSYTNDQIFSLYSHPLALLEQQRWGFQVLGILGLIDRHIPFWSTFAGIVIYTGAAVLFAYYWQLVTANRLSHRQLLVGVLLFIAFPLNCEILIYPSAFIWNGAFYVLVAAALVLSWEPHPQTSLRSLVASPAWLPGALCLSIAVSAYESFLFVFLAGVILALQVYLLQAERASWHTLWRAVRKPLVILVAALLIRQLLIGALGLFVSYAENGGGAAKEIAWLEVSSLRDIRRLLIKLPLKFTYYYLALAPFNIALLLFWVALLGNLFHFQARGRRCFFAVLWIALVGTLFGISLIKGDVQPYRNCQAFAPMVAFVLPVAFAHWPKRHTVRLLLAVMALFLCTKQASLYFDADLRAWQFAALKYHKLANDLQANDVFHKGKPVYIVGRSGNGASLANTLLPYALASRLDALVPNVYQHAAWTYFPTGSQGRRILRDLYGVSDIPLANPPDLKMEELFAFADQEQIPLFPAPGYIREYEDKIIVNVNHDADDSIPWHIRLNRFREELKARGLK